MNQNDSFFDTEPLFANIASKHEKEIVESLHCLQFVLRRRIPATQPQNQMYGYGWCGHWATRNASQFHS